MALNLDLGEAIKSAGAAKELLESSELDPKAIEDEVTGFVETLAKKTVGWALKEAVSKLTQEAARILAPGGFGPVLDIANSIANEVKGDEDAMDDFYEGFVNDFQNRMGTHGKALLGDLLEDTNVLDANKYLKEYAGLMIHGRNIIVGPDAKQVSGMLVADDSITCEADLTIGTMTLIELVLYMFLSVLAGVLLWSVNGLIHGGQQAAASSYLVSGETEKAMEWIRRDVGETALSSIKVFTNTEKSSEAPGASMVSNRAFDPTRTAARWSIAGALLSGASTCCIRWSVTVRRRRATWCAGSERSRTRTSFPLPLRFCPLRGGQSKQKVLLRGVLAPNLATADFGPTGSGVTDGFGGFRMQFIRRAGNGAGADTFTTVNPRHGNPSENTRMLECEMKILQQEQSKPHYYAIKFRVSANH